MDSSPSRWDSVSGGLDGVRMTLKIPRLRTPIPSVHAGFADRQQSEWPREESNLRTQIRSLPLYPLSYGAVRNPLRALRYRF